MSPPMTPDIVLVSDIELHHTGVWTSIAASRAKSGRSSAPRAPTWQKLTPVWSQGDSPLPVPSGSTPELGPVRTQSEPVWTGPPRRWILRYRDPIAQEACGWG